MSQRKNILKAMVVLFFVFLLLAGAFVFFFQGEKLEKHERGEMAFNEDFVKNSEINIYCEAPLIEGSFQTESLARFCDDESLPMRPFHLILEEVVFDGERAFSLARAEIENLPKKYVLVALEKKKGHFASLPLEKPPFSFHAERGRITLYFEEPKEYRLIGTRFEEIVTETIHIASADAGFSLQLPKNWEITKNEEGFSFYHPQSKYTHPVMLETEEYVLKTTENTPYKEEYENIKKTLAINEFHKLPDYRVFKKELSDYLKIDLEEGKIFYFNGEEAVEAFDILASGDPAGWNATPSGLYEIFSKEGLRFSTETSVYMPFSMRLYGKYLIHGEAYFPSGVPYTSEVSGGCVRVRNAEMKKLYELAEPGMPVLTIVRKKTLFPLKEKKTLEFPEITAKSFLVADINSGKVFTDRNPKREMPVSYLSHMMAAIVVTEHMGLTTELTVRDYMLPEASRTAGIYTGRRIRMSDLLVPLLAGTSNEAAHVLFHYLGRDNTLNYIQDKAWRIGMKNTVFSKPGEIEKSFSTAKDIYYLGLYLANSRVPLLNISRGARTPYVNYGAFPQVKNENLFYSDPLFLGGKTANTAEGYSGFFLFNLELGDKEREVIFVLLGAQNKEFLKEETEALRFWLEEAFN